MNDGVSQGGSKRALVLLTLGAGLGLVLAAAGLLGSGRAPGAALPEGAVARVNDALILADDYERLVAGLERDTRRPADADARRRILDRMIEEELLVQRALELGLARVDRRVRADLVSAMIGSISADAGTADPAEPELREFYAAESGFFTQPARLRVRQIFFRVRTASEEAAAEERAAQAVRRLEAGESFEGVGKALGDREISPLPDALLPALKLLEYLGPTALRAVRELEPGGTTKAVRSGTGFHVLKLLEREVPQLPPFEAIEAQVRAEWVRRAGDRTLRAYLDELRARARIVE